MTRALHLDKSGSGMSSKTACGRNILRTPMATNWDDFKNYSGMRCVKCESSRQFEVNQRADLAKWIPEDADAWMKSDDALVAKRKQA